ncbi:MAG: aromatic ring-hydroxylating dioxygenase subunit alpha [Actinomycetota bacterium]|nr:aromatic ring-hydroxylating dioxygenase subunit alpha [Actinomycetota bacterium]
MAPDDRLASLLNLDEGLIGAEVFTDPEIYEREMRDLYGHTWLFLAHESQLRKPGDFFSTYMGADAVIVARQRDGGLKAMLNACRHRGVRVCRSDEGNQKAFSCVYHGWTYGLDGALVNVPGYDEFYYSKLDKASWGLVQVRVEVYKGLIFGCFDWEAESLIDHLGDMAPYLDCLVDRRDGGTEVVAGVHKIYMKGNWKLAAEQLAGDTYHTAITHASAFSIRQTDGGAARAANRREGRQFSSDRGHGVAGFSLSNEGDIATMSAEGADPVLTEYFERIGLETEQRLGKAFAQGPTRTAGLVFPNLGYFAGGIGSTYIGVFHPKGPDRFEWWRWCLVDSAASPEEKAKMISANAVWPFSLGDADDGENWSELQRNLVGPQSRSQKLNYSMGIGYERDDDPDFPGRINYQTFSEMPQRGFYRRWLECLNRYDPSSVEPEALPK